MEYLPLGIYSQAVSFFWFCLISWACLRFGERVVSFLGFEKIRDLSRSESFLFSMGAGLSVYVLAVLTLGMLRALHMPGILGVNLFFLAAPLFIKQKLRPAGDSLADPTPSVRPFFTAACALPLVLSFLLCFLPPIGTDALSYHLGHPKAFIARQAFEYLLYSRESLWPYFSETLYTVGLMLGGTSLAALFHWIFYFLGAVTAYAVGKRILDERTAKLSCLIFLYTPACFAQASHAYVDLALAFFVAAAFLSFILFLRNLTLKHCLLCGIMTGSALGIKYLALGPFFMLMAFMLSLIRRAPKAVFFFAASALAVGGIWYVRSFWVIGNPVYPFFPGFFGGQGIESDIAQPGKGSGAVSFLFLPFNLVFYPQAFGGEIVGPLYLLGLPAIGLRGRVWSKQAVYLGVFLFFGLLFVFSQSQQARFFLSLAPLCAAAAASGLSLMMDLNPASRRLILTALTLVFLTHAGIFIYRARDCAAYFSGAVSAEEYLLKRERSYQGHLFFKQHLKAGERIFNSAEAKNFYGQAERMVVDNGLFRQALHAQNLPIESYLDRERFEYLWLSIGSDEGLLAYAENRGYSRVHSYEFTEAPASYRSVIYRRPA